MQAEINWIQQLGTSGKEAGNAVVVDGDNNYIYVGGYTTGALSDDGSVSDYSNPWVAKFYAKSGEKIWLKQLSYGEEYQVNSDSPDLAVDDDGVYVLIRINTTDIAEPNAIGKTLVIKFHLDTGEKEWSYEFQSDNDVAQQPSSIVTDGNGYLYVIGTVAGSMLSPDSDALDSTGDLDVWIAKLKLSTDPELDWIEQFGSSDKNYGMDLAIDGSSNVYAVGYTTGVMPVKPDTDPSEDTASEDIWIAKYDTDGNPQWLVQFGSEQDADDRANAVAVDDSGGVYAIGNTYGDLSDPNGDKLERWQTWVAKFRASSGERVWLDQLTDTDTGDRPNSPGTQGNGIAVDNHGNVYVAGSTDGKLTLDATDPYWNDIWLAKYHAYKGGEPVWRKQIASSDKDTGDLAYGITVDPSGNLYLTGYTGGKISDTATEPERLDIWLAQLREVPTPEDELVQVLKRYIDYKVSQSTETVLETSETTSTTTSSLLEVAADVVASNNSGSTEEESKQTTESDNSVSVLSEATSVANR